MTKATMREEVERLLPRQNAKAWVSSLELRALSARLKTRSLYTVLQWMELRGLVVRRKRPTGVYEYARAPRGK